MSQRVYGLDILRAGAILLVIAGHALYLIDRPRELYDGVGIFFVLSGFLIGQILLKTINDKPTNIFTFWTRRWLRTLPAYFVTLLILLTFYYFFGKAVSGIAPFFVFLQGMHHQPGFFPESWSLCTEEWFYLLTPIILFTGTFFFSKKRSMLVIAIAAIVLTTIARTYEASEIPADIWVWRREVLQVTFYRMDAIAFGIIAAWMSYYGHWKQINLLFWIGIFLAIIVIYNCQGDFGLFYRYLRLPLESVSTFLILPKLATIRTGKGLIYRFLTFTSIISYSLYLLNYSLVATIVEEYINGWLRVPVYLLMTFGLAYILNRTIEKPFMELRDRKTKIVKQKLQRAA